MQKEVGGSEDGESNAAEPSVKLCFLGSIDCSNYEIFWLSHTNLKTFFFFKKNATYPSGNY